MQAVVPKSRTLLPVKHPKIIAYSAKGKHWVSALYTRPHWDGLSKVEKAKLFQDSLQILQEVQKSRQEYPFFCKDSLVLVEGEVYLDGQFHPSQSQENSLNWEQDFIEVFKQTVNYKRNIRTIKDCKKAIQRIIKPKRFRIPKVVLIPLMSSAFFVFSFSVYNHNVLIDGYKILTASGAKQAFEFFSSKEETVESLFGKAWSLFRMGDYKNSRRLIEVMSHSERDRIQASAYYLLGNIFLAEGKFQESIDSFKNAEHYYELSNNAGAIYLTRLNLANVYVNLEEIQNAEFYLNLASTEDQKSQNEYQLFVEAKLAFIKGDFRSALDISINRLKLLDPEESRVPGVLSDIGFYYTLNNNFEKGMLYTLEAQNKAYNSGNELVFRYNQINWILLRKCTGIDTRIDTQHLIDYANEQGDETLMKQISFVQDFDCINIEKTDPGHPPPPPPDPPPSNPPPQNPDY